MRKLLGRPLSLLSALFSCLVLVCAPVALVGALLALTGCSSAAGREITVSGSTTMLPIAEAAAEKIKEEEGINALVSGLGSSAGIESVLSGTVDIATSSRDLTADEAASGVLQKTVIAHDGIAIIVNPENSVTNVSLAQLRGIYAGTITNWSELGGADEPILVVNRDEASGTREAFKEIVMQGTPFDKTAAVLPGTGQVRDVVSRTKNAIGYISLGFVESSFTKETVKPLSVDGVYPQEAAIQQKTYPISRDLFFFTRPDLSADAQAFIAFVLSDKMDQTIEEAGYLPLFPSEKIVQRAALTSASATVPALTAPRPTPSVQAPSSVTVSALAATSSKESALTPASSGMQMQRGGLNG